MAWPAEALLILMALAGCWGAAAAIHAGWNHRSLPLLISGLAILGSLCAEVGFLNGGWGVGIGSGIGLVTVLMAGVALGALAVYLLLPPPAPVPAAPLRPVGPAVNPDSEA
jgi:hypothetical protein